MKGNLIKTSLLALALLSAPAWAQEPESPAPGSKWSFGVGGGYRINSMRFSNLDGDMFPTKKAQGSGVFSVFVQGEFGSEGNLAVRPQISFLERGGKLTEIGRDNYDDINTALGGDVEIEDVSYTLHARYVDLRVPIIWQFGKAASRVRPYVYLEPIVGFAHGGLLKLQENYSDFSYLGVSPDVTKANLAQINLAAAAGVGVRFAIPVAQDVCWLGLEASYELGLTDTYGSKEKDSKAIDLAQLFGRSRYKIEGSRKFSGLELQATLAIPFSIFKSKAAPAPVVHEPVYVPEPVVETPIVETKPCYSLEEILDMMQHGESVEGKKICAIDDINFEYNKSTITPQSYPYLDRLAETLIRTNSRIRVNGHTDNIGSDEFNLRLSKSRAEAVVNYLVSKGVNRSKLSYEAYGASRPLTSNDTEEGRKLNRRVEFEIVK